MLNLAKLYNTYYTHYTEPLPELPAVPKEQPIEYTEITPKEYTEKFFKGEIVDYGNIYENEEQQNILLEVIENNKIGVLDNNQINELRSVLLFDDIKTEVKNETIEEVYNDIIEEENKLMEQPIPPSKVEEIVAELKKININPAKIEKYFIQNLPADLILKITIIFLLSLGISSLAVITIIDFVILPKLISK